MRQKPIWQNYACMDIRSASTAVHSRLPRKSFTIRLAKCALFYGASITSVVAATPLGSAPAAQLRPSPFADGQLVTHVPDGATAMAPSGREIYFMRGSDSGWTIMVARLHASRWSPPSPAMFSGRWRDLDPAIATDGKTLIFVSNRPAKAGGPALDAVYRGQTRTAEGMNLWRAERSADGWGEPVRLADSINSCSMTFAPSIARNGDLYYIGCDATGNALRLLRAPRSDDGYAMPSPVAVGVPGDTLRDPAIAPDQAFIVVSAKSHNDGAMRLAIAFRDGKGWGPLLDLGNEVNQGTHSMGAQLAADGTTLLFSSDRELPAQLAEKSDAGVDHVWSVSLMPLLTRHASSQQGSDQ